MAMGNMAGNMIVHPHVEVGTTIIGMIVWTALIFVVEYVGLKSGKIRAVLDGQPTIIIKRGIIQHKELKKLRLNIDDLTMLLRTNMVFSIKDVNYAILEPNGDVSILKVEDKQEITKKDMKIPPEKVDYIPSEIIADGKVIYKNLKELGKTEEWLKAELKAKSIYNVKSVVYAELQSDGELYIQEKM